MSNFVFVLDTNRKPLNPCTSGVARSLLKSRKASVLRMFPFTIILKKAVADAPEGLQLKIDPGSKVTGFAILRGVQVIWVADLSHRGQSIKASLESRSAIRRSRRNRHTRYRPARFLNRTRLQGWLAPSLMHRVLTIQTWVKRLIAFAPIGSIAQELVRFDLQQIQNPEISGTEYQQGTLYQYEVREYLLAKWNRTCAYCGAQNIPLEIEHIVPKVKGGTNRVSNLTLACVPCNQKKGTQDIKDFLSKKPDLLKRVLSQAKQPLKDAAAVNSTRWALFNALKRTGLSVTVGSGGQTKFNRTNQGLPKTHYFDAACVGDTPVLEVSTNQALLIHSRGHGTRQACGTDKYGFPTRHRSTAVAHFSFQTGDIVKVIVEKGKKMGTYVGRVLCRASGSFDISLFTGRVTGINHKCFSTIQRKDGYSYAISKSTSR